MGDPFLDLAPTNGQKPRRRISNSRAEREARDAKICLIPRELSLNDYAARVDGLQPPLEIRERWRLNGCPPTYTLAVRKQFTWRSVVYKERYNAWQRYDKREQTDSNGKVPSSAVSDEILAEIEGY